MPQKNFVIIYEAKALIQTSDTILTMCPKLVLEVWMSETCLTCWHIALKKCLCRDLTVCNTLDSYNSIRWRFYLTKILLCIVKETRLFFCVINNVLLFSSMSNGFSFVQMPYKKLLPQNLIVSLAASTNNSDQIAILELNYSTRCVT
jgi:hypothetical protein